MDDPPRWLCDEMLGRLARYLRILGCDTEYVQHLDDAQILERLRDGPRTLVTRDRALGHQVPGSIVIRSTDLPSQLAEMARSAPGLPRIPKFDRCTLCNGRLSALTGDELRDRPALPHPTPETAWECSECAHLYWEGTHTARLRSDLQRWIGGSA